MLDLCSKTRAQLRSLNLLVIWSGILWVLLSGTGAFAGSFYYYQVRAATDIPVGAFPKTITFDVVGGGSNGNPGERQEFGVQKIIGPYTDGGAWTTGNTVPAGSTGSVAHYTGVFSYDTNPYSVAITDTGGFQGTVTPSISVLSYVPPTPPDDSNYFTVYLDCAFFGSYSKPNDEKTPGTGTCSVGMARASAHLMLASLNIEDTPIRYSPARGPAMDFTLTYNQRGAQQPTKVPNFGPQWTFNWLSYVTDDPTNLSANAELLVRGGGIETFSGFSSGSTSLPDPQSHAVLVRTATTPNVTYEKRMPDGSKQVYGHSDGAGSSLAASF